MFRILHSNHPIKHNHELKATISEKHIAIIIFLNDSRHPTDTGSIVIGATSYIRDEVGDLVLIKIQHPIRSP